MIAAKLVAVGLVAAAALAPVPAAAGPENSGRGSRITWQSCTEPYFQGLDCGTMRVPVDWSRRSSGELSLSLVRRKAEEPANRLGSLLLHNGAGGSSIEQLRYGLVSGGIPGSGIAKRFDLVAVDPRGVGHSTPTTCAGLPQRAPGVTFFPTTEAQYRALVDNNRALAAACGNPKLMANLDLDSTARDMEAVRVGLGERQLNWYAIGWSAQLGKAYARLFPGRLRAMVADTVVDDTLNPVARLASEISAAEESFNRFAEWCRTAPRCVLTGQDVAALFDQLVAKADQQPIPTSTPGRALTGEDIRAAMPQKLVFKFPLWPRAAEAIQKALAGDATEFTMLPDKTLDLVQAQTRSCVENPPAATNFAELSQLARMARQLSPHLGGAGLGWNNMAGCQGWPVPVRQASTKPVRGVPPTLIAQSTHQSLAGYSSAFGLSTTLPGSVVLSRDGDDYSMYLFSPCVRQTMDSYLLDGHLPVPGTLCTD